MLELRDRLFFFLLVIIHKFFQGLILSRESLDSVLVDQDFILQSRALFFEIIYICIFFLEFA